MDSTEVAMGVDEALEDAVLRSISAANHSVKKDAHAKLSQMSSQPVHTQKVGLLRTTAKDGSGKVSSSTRPKKIGQAGTRKDYKIDEEVIGSPPPSKVRNA